jgi:hypothetical protein
MSKSKKDNVVIDEIKYTRERLLNSKALKEYQRDFAAVILTDKEYTISEAKAALDAVLKKGV